MVTEFPASCTAIHVLWHVFPDDERQCLLQGSLERSTEYLPSRLWTTEEFARL